LLLKKTEGPVKSMEYFGLTRHTESMSVKIPEETIKELLKMLKRGTWYRTPHGHTFVIIIHVSYYTTK
jgi:hypothetical protein